jgi:uncharacterized membrane protein
LSESTELGIEINPRQFSQNGLVVVSILGGFLFTALILVLQNQNDTVVNNINKALPNALLGIRASDAYFFIVYLLLGTTCFLAVILSLAMLMVASAKAQESTDNLAGFVGTWLLALPGGFGATISWLVVPYNVKWNWLALDFPP